MNYLGEKSLSSLLSRLCRIGWYVVLIGSIITGLFGAWLFFTPIDDPLVVKLASGMNLDINDKDWVTFKKLPFIVRFLILPYFIAVVVLLLKLMDNACQLFKNFSRNSVFTGGNVGIISTFSKLLIPFSILTFNFSSLMASLLLFLLGEIFKNGTALQEEHNLTV